MPIVAKNSCKISRC